jgi:hypothetical protein
MVSRPSVYQSVGLRALRKDFSSREAFLPQVPLTVENSLKSVVKSTKLIL